MRAALALLPVVLLAACGESGPTVLENEARQAQTAATMQGWDRAFGAPKEAIGRANQFGFRAGDYAADGATFLSKGNPITLSQSAAKTPNTGTFEAAGADADHIDRLVFTLSITDPANADTAKQRFVDVLKGFMGQYALADDKALQPILDERASDDRIAGAPASIAVDKAGENRTITVTFNRPTGTTPVFPDQGQADGNRA
ncbi:hypothetical protein [Sphingomonas sp. Y38-1Y]|uniref:hypothetical protein n=1 Tax=Sphingomonas sp. Y38-1Y TaxID=3078265 RepID=UPI0028E2A582|nr:hypothetical protein [Sphingomonas sp. Y38-1Y]